MFQTNHSVRVVAPHRSVGGRGPIQTLGLLRALRGIGLDVRSIHGASAEHLRSICRESSHGTLLDFLAKRNPFPHGTDPANQEWRFEHADIKCGFPHTTEVL